MRVGLLAAAVLVGGCSAKEYLLTPPPFDAARNSAVLAFVPDDPALPPAQIEAFDLEGGFPQFGFRSDIIGVGGVVFAQAYDESLDELELTLGAVDAALVPAPCARARPTEALSYALSEGEWIHDSISGGLETFLLGSLPCKELSSCINPRFTTATPVPADYAMKLFHRLGPDRFLTGGGSGLSVVGKEGIESNLPAFWSTLPRGRSTPAADGRVWMFNNSELALVDLANESRTESFSFGDLHFIGVGQSPDSTKVIALVSDQRIQVAPPYTAQVWLHINGAWQELFETTFQQALFPTTSPVAWASNDEAILTQRGGSEGGLLLHYKNGSVTRDETVPGAAGVVVDANGNVFVGSTTGRAYHLQDDGSWRDIGGDVGLSLHGMLALNNGVMITGFSGALQEIYLDGSQCELQSPGVGIATHVHRNRSGFVVAGVEPSYVVWAD